MSKDKVLCLVRLTVPGDWPDVIEWMERTRTDLKPSRTVNPDGSISLDLAADLADPSEGGAFAEGLVTAAAAAVGHTGKLPVMVELWPLEERSVKPGEPDPILLTISLTFCIHLQNTTYTMVFDGRRYDIKLEKVWRNSRGASTDDSVSSEPTRFETGSIESPTIGLGPVVSPHIGTNIEIKEDPHGRYRYTRMTFQLNGQAEAELDVTKLVESVLPIVNRFVDVYRYVTGRAYLPPVQIEDIEAVELLRPLTGEGQYVFLFGRGHEIALINEPVSVHDRVRAMLVEEMEVPLHADLLLAAKRLLAQGVWRQAIIEAVVALEVFVDRLLKTELVDRQGISQVDFDALMDKEGRSLSDRMRSPMRKAINGSPATESPQLWERWVRVNAARRQVVHGGVAITAAEATEVVEVTSELIRLLESMAAKARVR